MAKKIFAVAFAMVLVFALVALTSCELIPGGVHEHEFGEWEYTTVPTCKSIGARMRKCECGEYESEQLPAQHLYDMDDVCRVCGFKEGDFFVFTWIYGESYAVSANNITDNNIEEIPEEITIPAYHRGYPVTEINADGFMNCKDLKKVNLPDSITTIGYNAFYGCANLESISGKSVVTIKSSAFSNCKSLKTVNLGDNITSMGQSAFSGCESLTSAIIPQGVTVLEDGVFDSCFGITEVTIPDHITEIGALAFSNCKNLESVTLPDSIKKMGKNPFNETKCYENLKNSSDGVVYLGSYLLTADETVAKNYTVKEGTTVIAAVAFQGLPITDLTLPDSLVNVGVNAFADCEKLVNVDFGNGVKYISESAFRNTSVTTIYLPYSIEHIGSKAFNIDRITSSFKQDVSLPDKAIELYRDSFYYDSSYYDETGAIYIGKHLICAYGVNPVAPFVVKEGTITIAARAFTYGPTGRTNCVNVVLPDSLQYICDYAFSDCKSLVSVNIPKNVTYIGKYAFHGCSSLTGLTFDDPDGWYISEVKGAIDGITVPSESLSIPEGASKYLKSTYAKYYWTKKS